VSNRAQTLHAFLAVKVKRHQNQERRHRNIILPGYINLWFARTHKHA